LTTLPDPSEGIRTGLHADLWAEVAALEKRVSKLEENMDKLARGLRDFLVTLRDR